MSWSDLSDWWVTEIEDDPAYEAVVNPMLLDVLQPEAGRTYLDLACGEGRVMRALKESGAAAHGVELTLALARRAADSGPVVLGRLPDLGFLRDDSYDGAYCVLALEHIEDEGRFFAEAARAVRPGGVFALVINHPFRTAPEATPISDSDGETLWRPGDYFSSGTTDWNRPARGRCCSIIGLQPESSSRRQLRVGTWSDSSRLPTTNWTTRRGSRDCWLAVGASYPEKACSTDQSHRRYRTNPAPISSVTSTEK